MAYRQIVNRFTQGVGLVLFYAVFRPMKKAVCGIRPLLIYGIQYSSFSTWKRRLRHKNRCFEKLTLFSNARLQFYSNNYVLSTSQIVDARVIALENGDVIELNDDC